MYQLFLSILFLLETITTEQQRPYRYIKTDDGSFPVFKTSKGKDMILIKRDLWNDMVFGTRYSFKHLKDTTALHACIEISSRSSHCLGGIGFRCSIYDCASRMKENEFVVDGLNRICSVMILAYNSSTVKLIFLNRVDWADLADTFNIDPHDKNNDPFDSIAEPGISE